MKISVIYKITNPDGRVYIGQTSDWKTRMNKYINSNCKNQPIVFNSISKYGYDRHIFEIIEKCEPNKLNETEMFYIDLYKTNNHRFPEINGMNCNDGGGTSRGFKHTEEAKEKLRQINLGKTYENRSKANYGKKVINILTGEIFKSIKDAAKNIKVSVGSLQNQLKSKIPNTTSLRLL